MIIIRVTVLILYLRTILTGDYEPQVVADRAQPLYGATYSTKRMNWWSTSNWCQANGTSLMTLSTLNTLSGEDSDAARKTALQGGLGKTSGTVWLEKTYKGCLKSTVYFTSGHIHEGVPPVNMNQFALCH